MTNLSLINKELYEFDPNYGIYSKYFRKYLKGAVMNNGYIEVSLNCVNGKKERFLYHRVIAFMLCPIPQDLVGIPVNELHVDHINGNRQDNRACNLRWCTQAQNNQFELFRKRCSLAKIGKISRPPSEETKRKISAALKGRHHTEETKMKMRKPKRKAIQ